MTATVNEHPSGTGALRPRARLLRTLGDDLISSDKVALLELVKNSFDADASVVIVRFVRPQDPSSGRIEVWDDGHGMDVETLQGSWLDIATDVKRKRSVSDAGRRMLGEKGIGRLAAARLSHELMMTSKRINSIEVSLLIDWRQFDRADAYLDEIEVAWEVGATAIFDRGGAATEIFEAATTGKWHRDRGTVLRMDHLSHAWSRDDFLELRTALARLIRPRPSKALASTASSPGTGAGPGAATFRVVLELTDAPEDVEVLAGPVDTLDGLQAPHYRLSGSVDSDGVATMRYSQQEPALDEDLGSKLLWQHKQRGPSCGPFEFELNVWDRDKEALARTVGSTSTGASSPSIELKRFRDALDDVAGVSIYRDGFRVLPFGEKGDDWLGLDLRRVQSPTRRLSNNQLIGHVFIGADDNSNLRDQTNREGMLAGSAYSDLQRLVQAALNELEVRRYAARRSDNTPGAANKGGLFARFDLSAIKSELSIDQPNARRVLTLIEAKDREIQEGVTEVQQVLSRYSRLATLGSLVDRVLHDGRTIVTRLKNAARFGIRDLDSNALLEQQKVSAARAALEKAELQTGVLSSLFNQIEPFGGRKRGRPKEVRVHDAIANVITIMKMEADDLGVTLIAGECDHVTRVDESELLTVLVNLVQNAIFWTSTRPQGQDRVVLVDARVNEDSSLTFIVSDSGPGVAPELRELIFDPYFSSKPDGVGLGLSIAGLLVGDVYAGELVLVHDGPLPGATFEATFRRRS
ncbi:signal transduction histidine kinase [Agrococcus sp. UYP10]|uniref:sensor histidine kinase n=1 Tax=Agrococcus sp. UYP10 TaxID=1756355 RepID=UPI003394B2C9